MNTIQDKFCECGRPAVIYYKTANRYGCTKNPHQCPGYKLRRTSEKAIQRMEDRQILLDRVSRGEEKCIYCGGVAKGIIESKLLPICQEKNQQSCPEYKKRAGAKISKSLKQAYKDRPEMIEAQRKIAFEVHNRPVVVLKKINTMKKLHKDPEFTNHYRNGIKKYFDGINSKLYNKLHAAAKTLFSHGCCSICGITEEECISKYKKGLHMHCLTDIHIMKKENWQELCGSCHMKIHAILRKQIKEGK
jgi:hypothetical protein